MDTLAPNTANYTKGGVAVLLQRNGTSGYVDLGNLPDFSLSLISEFLEHTTARSGKIIVDHREQTKAGVQFKIGQDEFNAANLALVLNAATPSAFSQASGTAVAISFATPTLGAKYFLGAYRVTTVVVKVSAVTKTLGTDYTVDLDSGDVLFLPTGTILDSDTVDITFNKPAISGETVAPITADGMIEGAIKIIFRATDGRIWVYNHTKATIDYSGDLSMDGTAFAKASGVCTIEPDYTQSNPFGLWTMLPAA